MVNMLPGAVAVFSEVSSSVGCQSGQAGHHVWSVCPGARGLVTDFLAQSCVYVLQVLSQDCTRLRFAQTSLLRAYNQVFLRLHRRTHLEAVSMSEDKSILYQWQVLVAYAIHHVCVRFLLLMVRIISPTIRSAFTCIHEFLYLVACIVLCP